MRFLSSKKAASPYFTGSFLLLLVLSAAVASAFSQPSASGLQRSRTKFIEPPSPAPDWNTERRNQLSFKQLAEEFGVRLKGQYESEGVSDAGTIEHVQFGITWLDQDRIKVEFGTILPGVRGVTERALGKVSFEFSKDPTITEVAGEIPVGGDAKFIVSGKFDRTKDTVASLGVEVKKLFLKFKGEVATDQPNRIAKNIEIKLIDLYSLNLKGLQGTNREIAIEVDASKFYNAFVRNAPAFVDFSKDPARKAVNAVAFQFDPLMVFSAVSDDPSYFRISKAITSLQQSLSDGLPKGVKIQYSDAMLTDLLRNSRAGAMEQLASNLASASDEQQRRAILDVFVRESRSRSGGEARGTGTDLALVSLKALVAAAEPYASRWGDLPLALKRPGNLSRIVGFVNDVERNDLVLIGERGTPQASLSIDDLIVGFQAVLKFNATPLCSLDPDPADPEGPQRSRIGGVPNDSGFALTMLEADHLMKKMAAGTVVVTEPGYITMGNVLERLIGKGSIPDLSSRFWFYPRSLQPGDIETSSDGRVVSVRSGIEVLTQRIVLSHDGIVSSDRLDETADQWARGFNRVFGDLQPKHPEFQRLHGLFDVVLTAKILQKLEVQPQLLDRFNALPYERVAVPATYASVKSDPISGPDGEAFYVAGGVNLSMTARNSSFNVTDRSGFSQLRTAASGMPGPVSKISVSDLRPASLRTDRTRTVDPAAILSSIQAGNTMAAENAIQEWITTRPYDPEPWRLLALSDLVRARYDSAIANADRAVALESDDTVLFASASIIRFQAHSLSGRNAAALAEIDAVVDRVPKNPRARLLRAEALSMLERSGEARKEFREALSLAPNSTAVHLSFGLFEIGQGFSSRGRSYIDKAKALSPRPTTDPNINSAFALSEISLSLLGDVENRLANASRYADLVLADRTADPVSRIRALSVKTMLSFVNSDAAEAEAWVNKAIAIAPNNPGPMLMIVDWAIGSNRPDLAKKYLAMAEKIAPNFPAVARFRRTINK
ncbi:MAG: tetratricopeptide repeat protein [Pyrinomonadaceae bacterium]